MVENDQNVEIEKDVLSQLMENADGDVPITSLSGDLPLSSGSELFLHTP